MTRSLSISYPRARYSRVAAWLDCKKRGSVERPSDRGAFTVPEGAWRKDHDADSWTWYAAYVRFADGRCLPLRYPS